MEFPVRLDFRLINRCPVYGGSTFFSDAELLSVEIRDDAWDEEVCA